MGWLGSGDSPLVTAMATTLFSVSRERHTFPPCSTTPRVAGRRKIQHFFSFVKLSPVGLNSHPIDTDVCSTQTNNVAASSFLTKLL